MPSIHLFIKQFIMLSTIKIDFDGDMNPIILVSLVQSVDVRDKLLHRFFEELGGESNTLHVEFGEKVDSIEGRKVAHPSQEIIIRPVSAIQLQRSLD